MDQFTKNHKVINLIEDLKEYFETKEKLFSDVVDNEGNQYVDFVQEGGGVLGIALIGYIYVLEKFNIRFMNLAGTSAGSISTLLLAVTGKVNESKSEKLLELLANKNFYEFVDGSRKSKNIIRETLTEQRKWKLIIQGLGIIRSLNKKMGLNPGNNFEEWLENILKDKNIYNSDTLIKHINNLPESLTLREGIEGNKVFENKIKIIASDISTQTKAIFPEMANLYFKNPNDIIPSKFVRASMSIPIFFEPLIIRDIPSDEKDVLLWRELADYKGTIPNNIKFVDGGVMSNFPIDLFHTKNQIPRKPTFGVKLGEERIEETPVGNLFQLIYASFNSARQIRDFEFINNNQDYKELVEYVDLSGFEWLNFDLSESDKVEMFIKGCEAASNFLKRFNWNEYKALRRKLMMDDLEEIIVAN